MQAMKFRGSGLEYFKIWIVNILLTIITLTLYYPWAKVRNRRYFYAHSELDNQNFEYHATGKQLFVGYLIAMAILIVYVLVQQVSPIGGAIGFLLFILALPWIIWRSLIFNMRVTSFSNVGFSFNGGLGAAYFNYLLMPILLFLSFYAAPVLIAVMAPTEGEPSTSLSGALIAVLVLIGLSITIYVYGVLKKRNASYVINGTKFGQGQFNTNLRPGPFIAILLKTIGLSIVALIACLVLAAVFSMLTGATSSLMALSEGFENPEVLDSVLASGAVIMVLAVVYIGFLFVSILLFSYSMSRQRKYIYANSDLDQKISFASTLGARGLAWVSTTNLLAILFTLGLAIPWASVRMARYMLEHTQVDTSLGFSDYISEKRAEQSSLGEQIGDAFDVDVGIGF